MYLHLKIWDSGRPISSDYCMMQVSRPMRHDRVPLLTTFLTVVWISSWQSIRVPFKTKHSIPGNLSYINRWEDGVLTSKEKDLLLQIYLRNLKLTLPLVRSPSPPLYTPWRHKLGLTEPHPDSLLLVQRTPSTSPFFWPLWFTYKEYLQLDNL